MKFKFWYTLLIFILLSNSCKSESIDKKSPLASGSELYERLYAKAEEAYKYCLEQQMNTDYCMLIDMSVPSGKFRFFIWDFHTASVTHQYLVTHGTCDGSSVDGEMRYGVNFSNLPDSHCSSLGKYKTGRRDYSSWGIHIKYWLHGQEATNDKAYERVVVLHSWEIVPDAEIYPASLVRSWGCPAVSNLAMEELDRILDVSDKPALLWIFV